MGELSATQYLAVLVKWQLREEAQKTQRFGLLEENIGGTETEKVDKTQLQRQPEVPYKGLHLMLPLQRATRRGQSYCGTGE